MLYITSKSQERIQDLSACMHIHRGAYKSWARGMHIIRAPTRPLSSPGLRHLQMEIKSSTYARAENS